MTRLDLASGPLCPEGYEGVDLVPHPGVVHVVDLLHFPWPFEDGCASELRVSHFVEHIAPVYITPDGTTHDRFVLGSMDLLCRFWDECFRVLEPGGTLHVISPQAHNDRNFADPQHRRFFVPASFLFLDRTWRESVGIGPLMGYCEHADFPFRAEGLKHTFPAHTAATLKRVPARSLAEMHYEKLNVMEDLDVTLVRSGTPVPAFKILDRNGEGLSAADLEKPHLFRVTGAPGGFTVRPGNMTLPGDRPMGTTVVAFPKDEVKP